MKAGLSLFAVLAALSIFVPMPALAQQAATEQGAPATSPITTSKPPAPIPEEKYRPLLRNWEHSATEARFTILAVDGATGEATVKYIGRSGREVPMAGRVSVDADGTLRLQMRGGVNLPVEWDLKLWSGKLVGTVKTTDLPGDALVWPAK